MSEESIEDFDKLRVLAETVATIHPGPWSVDAVVGNDEVPAVVAVMAPDGKELRVDVCEVDSWFAAADPESEDWRIAVVLAGYIAEVNPTTVLALLARLARADAIEQAARQLLDTTNQFRDTPPCSTEEKRAIAKNESAESALRAALEAS